jgi:hypothetical protein
MKKIAFLWVLLPILIGPTIGFAQNKTSQAGNWKLDTTQCDFGSEPGPRSATLTILTDTPQMYSYRVHGVDEKGKPFAVSWRGPEDGAGFASLVPVSQADAGAVKEMTRAPGLPHWFIKLTGYTTS